MTLTQQIRNLYDKHSNDVGVPYKTIMLKARQIGFTYRYKDYMEKITHRTFAQDHQDPIEKMEGKIDDIRGTNPTT